MGHAAPNDLHPQWSLEERKVSAQGSPAVTRVTARKLLLLAAGGAFLFATVGMVLKPKASPRQPVATAPAPIPVTAQKVTNRDRKRGKSRGGTIIRFTRRHESDLFWEWCRLQTLMIF